MMTTNVRTNRRIVLAARPQGAATLNSFRMEEVPVGAPREGEVFFASCGCHSTPTCADA